jgi:uncharacterized LabA/DUF88 family protein
MNTNNEKKLAVLFDADNVPYSHVKQMLDEITKYGNPTIKRIYGDWTKPSISGWKSVLLENAIIPVQQYSYTTGKNATDSAMIIDAMDILHLGQVDGFCIVSSDSDFTRLATRLREAGKYVIGIGEKKTPKPFIVSCDKFIYIEILGNNETPNVHESKTTKEVSKPTKAKDIIGNDIINLLNQSIDDLADDSGWAFLADVGNLILKKKPDFDPRNYGFSKLTPLIESCKTHFTIDRRNSGDSRIKHIFVKRNT